MTYMDNSPVKGRSSAWSEWTRRCSQRRHFQKRYWCFWIVAGLFPVTLLRMVYLCNLSSVKEQQSSEISVVMMESEERLPHKHPSIGSGRSTITELDAKSSTSIKGEVSWMSLHERVSIENSQPKKFRKKNHKDRKRKTSQSQENHFSRQSFEPQPEDSEGHFGLPEDNEKEGNQPNGEYPTSAGNIADEGHKMEAEEHFTATEEMLNRSESEEKGPVAHTQAEDPKGVDEPGEAQGREVHNEMAMEIRDAKQQLWTSEEQKWKDERQKAQPEEVAAANETEQQKEEEERKNVEAIEEKREEEELKDAEGIEREMIEEQEIWSTEQEEKHENGGAVIEGVTDQTQGEQPEEAKSAGECDLFEGDWVWDPEGPLYTNSTCFYMQLAQNCMSNGRPDTDYLHWKWKPRECDLPRFDARAFLEAFRGKTIGFVGDSLARNQMQSLLCMLSQIEIPKLIYQSHDDATVQWLYEQHQVTLAVLWSPYLLKESNEGIMGFEKGQSVLHLDELDTAWTSVMQDLDIMVLSIGQWYFKGSIYVQHEEAVGCHYCPGFNFTAMEYQAAYRGAVRQVLEKVASEFKGIVIMSTFAISHFEDGPWDNGGQCRREKPLDKEESARFPGLHNDMHDIVMSEFNSIAYDKSRLNENVKLEFLDVTRVSLTRADGHPGPYRHANPYEGKDPNEWVPNDCLHWCLPGPVDTWNQLLVEIVHRHL